MRRHWNADGAYWCRLSKAQLIAALETSATFEDMPGLARTQAMKVYGKLKQDELAAEVDEAFSGLGNLPETLVVELGLRRLVRLSVPRCSSRWRQEHLTRVPRARREPWRQMALASLHAGTGFPPK